MTVPLAGAKTKASDWTSAFPLNTDAWVDYVPTFTQSTTITKTITTARYTKVARKVTVNVYLSATGAGTAANTVQVSLPVAVRAGSGGAIGHWFFIDVSTGQKYAGSLNLVSATVAVFSGPTGTNDLGGTGHPFALAVAAGDLLSFTATYEAAS